MPVRLAPNIDRFHAASAASRPIPGLRTPRADYTHPPRLLGHPLASTMLVRLAPNISPPTASPPHSAASWPIPGLRTHGACFTGSIPALWAVRLPPRCLYGPHRIFRHPPLPRRIPPLPGPFLACAHTGRVSQAPYPPYGPSACLHEACTARPNISPPTASPPHSAASRPFLACAHTGQALARAHGASYESEGSPEGSEEADAPDISTRSSSAESPELVSHHQFPIRIVFNVHQRRQLIIDGLDIKTLVENEKAEGRARLVLPSNMEVDSRQRRTPTASPGSAHLLTAAVPSPNERQPYIVPGYLDPQTGFEGCGVPFYAPPHWTESFHATTGYWVVTLKRRNNNVPTSSCILRFLALVKCKAY
ncbi:hypothetical protein B0H16DRAFT_1456765 [Mycena metata]|uniref:Uncharacterized protein n=1 Tax=Mycena metata TaxID=1033252 RepID=A0AAD7NHC9_9AGAR|nr:hypothetical protein B0H16DRAFT_1456765 [Mycena metata]